jgi:thiamine pyrophosphate-dependent acetolactate synthase large subunit-like protein
MTGSMGLAASIGVGIALSSALPVVVVDGDGSLAMNPGCPLTAGAMPNIPLLHLVLDDGLYESTGGQGVPSQRVDFTALARAAGYREVSRADNLSTFGKLLKKLLEKCSTPTFVHCVLTSREMTEPPPRIETDLYQHHLRFSQHLNRVNPELQ